MSFYSRDLYRDCARNWRGHGILYLLLLHVLSWLPSSMRWFGALREFSVSGGREIVDQLPVVRIQDGMMSAEPGGRHVVTLEEGTGEDGMLLIIDDSIDQVPADLTSGAIVLTRREFGTIQPSRNERRVWALTPGADMEVTPAGVQSFFSSLPFWVPPLGYGFCVAGSLAFRIMQVFLYGLIGQALARRRNAAVEYRALVRMAALAVTPAIVIRTLIWFGPWDPPWYFRWPAFIAIALAYLAFGIRAAAVEDAAPAFPPPGG